MLVCKKRRRRNSVLISLIYLIRPFSGDCVWNRFLAHGAGAWRKRKEKKRKEKKRKEKKRKEEAPHHCTFFDVSLISWSLLLTSWWVESGVCSIVWPLVRIAKRDRVPLTGGLGIHTYLAGETPWSGRWFTQGEARPLHSGCADPCEFPKCGNLDCIIYGSGGLRSRSPLDTHWSKEQMVKAPLIFLFFFPPPSSDG